MVSSGRPDNTGSSLMSSAVMTTTMKSYPWWAAGVRDRGDHDVFPIVRIASALEVQLLRHGDLSRRLVNGEGSKVGLGDQASTGSKAGGAFVCQQ